MGKNRAKNVKQFKRSILIYCDGITEKCYLSSLKTNRFPSLSIVIKPLLGSSDNFEVVFNEIGHLLDAEEQDQYQFIFYLKDMDTVYKQDKVKIFRRGIEKISRKKQTGSRFMLIESRPCFDFWILLHFDGSDKLLTCYDELENQLRKYMPVYEKKEKYSKVLYEKVKGNTDIAMNHSRNICNKRREPGEEYSYTLMHRVIEELRHFE